MIEYYKGGSWIIATPQPPEQSMVYLDDFWKKPYNYTEKPAADCRKTTSSSSNHHIHTERKKQWYNYIYNYEYKLMSIFTAAAVVTLLSTVSTSPPFFGWWWWLISWWWRMRKRCRRQRRMVETGGGAGELRAEPEGLAHNGNGQVRSFPLYRMV